MARSVGKAETGNDGAGSVGLGRRVKRRITRWVALFASTVLAALPLPVLRWVGNALGRLICLAASRRRRIADKNIEACFGDRFSPSQRRRIILESCQNITKSLLELFKFSRMKPEEVAKLVEFEGVEHLRDAAAEGNGVIVVTAHYGNWELLGAMIGELGYKLTVVARDASDPETAEMVNAARRRLGMRVLGREDLGEMLKVLRQGDVLGVLPDQRQLKSGRLLRFLGRPAPTALGPAVLALRSRAPLVPAFARRLPNGRFKVVFRPPIRIPKAPRRTELVGACMQAVNDAISREIAEHPEQWLWFHDRWATSAGNAKRGGAGGSEGNLAA